METHLHKDFEIKKDATAYEKWLNTGVADSLLNHFLLSIGIISVGWRTAAHPDSYRDCPEKKSRIIKR
jgi:hypothetical protein